MARPVEFERTKVLDRASRLFWDKGYCATSVSDLVTATGLRPGSIYGAFESKEGLFIAALDYYGDQSLEKVRKLLQETKDPLEGIRQFLHQLAEEGGRLESRRGCFLVNTALEVAPHNRRVRQRVTRHLKAIEEAFVQSFQAALEAGWLKPGADPELLARYLMVTIWGIRVMQRLGTGRDHLEQVVNEHLRLFDQAWLA